MATNFDDSSTRSKIISNQIGEMWQTDQFTGDGFTTQFTLTFECYYTSYMAVSDSSEIKVFDNGLKLERYGASSEYGMILDGSSQNKIIDFDVAPLSGHIITAEYRPLVNKT
jgi:hypothetical protein